MTNISKHVLKKEFENELFAQFIKIFSSSSKKQNGELLSSLFSEAERIMFMKRLAVIVLINKDTSSYKIAQQLSVSETTVHTIAEQIETGRYAPILKHVNKRSFNREKFIKTLEWILLGGGIMPAQTKEGWKRAYGIETPYPSRKKNNR